MATLLVMDNAIAWAHWRLRGGLKGMLSVSGALAAIVVVGIVASIRLTDTPATTVYSHWMHGLLGFQMLLLSIMAPARVGTAIRRDLSSKLIESHRIMPIPAYEAIVGYLVGPSAASWALGLTTFILGGIAAVGAGFPLDRWLTANLIIALFGLFQSVIVAFISFARGNATAMVVGLFLVVVISRGYAAEILPGLMVLCGPLIHHTVFALEAGSKQVTAYAISIAAQLVVGGLYFFAAGRRYRRADAIGFNPLMGIALLVAWGAISVAGILDWHEMSWSQPFEKTHEEVQLIASLSVGLLVALAPVCAMAWLETNRARERRQNALTARRSLMGALVIASATAIIVMIAASAMGVVAMADRLERTAVLTASFLITLYCVGRIVYRASPSIRASGSLVIVVAGLGPLVIATVLNAFDKLDSESTATIVSFSHFGAIAQIWMQEPGPTTPGLVGQALLALASAALFHRTSRKIASPEIQYPSAGPPASAGVL